MSYNKGDKKMPLSVEAKIALNEISQGMRLCIPKLETDITACLMMHSPLDTWCKIRNHHITPKVALELVDSGLLGKLTEFTNNCKIGWREKELPGDKYTIYACLQ